MSTASLYREADFCCSSHTLNEKSFRPLMKVRNGQAERGEERRAGGSFRGRRHPSSNALARVEKQAFHCHVTRRIMVPIRRGSK